MSAVPTPYVPETSFTTEAEQPITTAGLPGPELDAEFANIATTLNSIRSRLTEIQRDDGELANEIVTPSSLSTEVLALITAGAYTVRGLWTANESYNVGDIYGNEDVTYLVMEDYQTGATFGETDTDATTILGQSRSAGDIVIDTFTGDGIETEFTLSKAPLGTNNLQVSVNGLDQTPGIAFTYSGTTLTFTDAPPAPGGSDPNIVARIGVTAEVQTTSMPNDSVTEDKLTTNSVSTTKIQDDAVTAAKILDSAITTAKIADGAVTEVKLATNSVSSSKLQNGAVTSGILDSNSVTTVKIQNQAVTSAKLANEAVASDAIAASAVTTAKVNDAAITTAKINNGAVTTAKLADDSVTAAKIADGTIVAENLSSSLPIARVLLNGDTSATALSATYSRTGTTVTVTHNDYVSANYTQSGATITINKSNHGLIVGERYNFRFISGVTGGEYAVASVIDADNFTIIHGTPATASGNAIYSHFRAGHYVYFDATSGAATDGLFQITIASAEFLQFEHGSSGSTSGTCSLPRGTINKKLNVASLVRSGTGDLVVNFSINMPDANYCMSGIATSTATTPNRIVTRVSTSVKTTKAVGFNTATGGGTPSDCPEFSLIIHP